MPNENNDGQDALNYSQPSHSQAGQDVPVASSRKASSTISLRSNGRSPSLTAGSNPPLTPEESPPFVPSRKRSAGAVEQSDEAFEGTAASPAHTRTSSGESVVHLCICQPEPKPPRPRNAFILYRQHHQAGVVARHPGLSNPDISKIIGEQWQNETEEQKVKWKGLAEEEKQRHHALYPNYRYQPKRPGRRTSVDTSASAGEKPNCQKCGGRTILTPSGSQFAGHNSVPSTPASTTTPLSRTLPVFRDLTLESPAARRSNRPFDSMPTNQREFEEERDDVGPLSPDSKRRRYNNDPRAVPRILPPGYTAVPPPPGAVVLPGTPFPFGPPVSSQILPPTPLHNQAHRESLPAIKGMVNPQSAMPPPPRPGMGYQQHRLSQGHAPQDRTLILPPLQTGRSGSIGAVLGSGKTIHEQIDGISFRYKIKVLSQVAPPAAKTRDPPRGPLIAVEGDDPEAAKDLAVWLRDNLMKDEHLTVKFFGGPQVAVAPRRDETMANYHVLAAEWLRKSQAILNSITSQPASADGKQDANMMEPSASAASTSQTRQIDESYDEKEEDSASPSKEANTTTEPQSNPDKTSLDNNTPAAPTKKPIALIPNYSLHTCNALAHAIPIGATEAYAAYEHWQWTATLWRGVIGPDLTVYVRDIQSSGGATGPSVETEGGEHRGDVPVFVVKRVRDAEAEGTQGQGQGIEASVLRRVGFEVGEWVREFGVVGGE